MPLQFAPGTNIAYSSAGILLLSEVVTVLSGQSLADYLRDAVFTPLGMHSTTLGVAERRQRAREVTLSFEKVQANTDHDHNSEYWRNLGAPWGGLLTTAEDLSRFYQAMLRGGELDGARILQPETARQMTRSQTHGEHALPSLPRDRQTGLIFGDEPSSSWGLGFRINEAELKFGETASAAFGHHGASGCMVWADPASGLSCAVLTTEPSLCYSDEFNRLSALVVAAG